jgi:hypothetical protein
LFIGQHLIQFNWEKGMTKRVMNLGECVLNAQPIVVPKCRDFALKNGKIQYWTTQKQIESIVSRHCWNSFSAHHPARTQSVAN